MSTECQQHQNPHDHDSNDSNSEFIELHPDHPDHPDHRSHHLLKHCLSNGQKTDALQHFSCYDVKEVAKEISRMGQRDLQAKFKLVYGTGTHSNNNDWLRRKLFEAVGAAPIKAAAKPKARKPVAKARKVVEADTMYHGSYMAAHGNHTERRSRRTPKGTPKAAAFAKTIFRSRTGHIPASPLGGASILDYHRHHFSDHSTSGSDGDSQWRDQEMADDDCDTPRSAFQQPPPPQMMKPPLAANAFLPGRPLALPAGLMGSTSTFASFSRASSSNLLRLQSLNFDISQQSIDQWANDSWADLVLASSGPSPADTSMGPSGDDEEVPMLQFDMAPFNNTADILM